MQLVEAMTKRLLLLLLLIDLESLFSLFIILSSSK